VFRVKKAREMETILPTDDYTSTKYIVQAPTLKVTSCCLMKNDVALIWAAGSSGADYN
jgi:hypothetical protein